MHTEQAFCSTINEIDKNGMDGTNGMDVRSYSEPNLNAFCSTIIEIDKNGMNGTNGMDVRCYSEPNLNDSAITFPHELLETPSPITEELPFHVGPETPEKKCQNAAVSQKVQEDTESDWDTESDSFSFYVRRPLSKEEIRVRERNSFLKFACGLLFGFSVILVLDLLLVKWIHEFSQRKEDELIIYQTFDEFEINMLYISYWKSFSGYQDFLEMEYEHFEY